MLNDWKIDKSWSLFLDRDGVINHRIMGGYVTTVEEFKLLEGVKEAFSVFYQKFNYVFVVTNQQGIGKGLMTESNLFEIHSYMKEQLNEKEGELTNVYFAPELKSDPNNTRKPKPTMALKAQAEFEGVDFEKAIMVGDTDSDILFGKNSGMKTVRIQTEEPINVEADLTFNSLFEFAQMLNN